MAKDLPSCSKFNPTEKLALLRQAKDNGWRTIAREAVAPGTTSHGP
jgi:hypothetical protein